MRYRMLAAQETERKAEVAMRLKDDRAAINDLFMAHVFEYNTAKEIIDKLDGICQPKGSLAMLGLRSKLYLLKNQKF